MPVAPQSWPCCTSSRGATCGLCTLVMGKEISEDTEELLVGAVDHLFVRPGGEVVVRGH